MTARVSHRTKLTCLNEKIPGGLGRLIAVPSLAAEGSDHGAVLVVLPASRKTASSSVLHSGAFSDSDAAASNDKVVLAAAFPAVDQVILAFAVALI